MALSADALCSLAQLKQYLQITLSEHDSFMEGLIEAVSARFAAYTGRHLTARDYSPDPEDEAFDPDNAVLSGTGHAELLLPQYPVITLSQLLMDGCAVAQAQTGALTGWVLDRAAGVLSLMDQVFPLGRHNVLLTYRAGFEIVPPDLAQAAVEQSAVLFQESAAGHGRLGLSARTLADGSVSYTQKPLLPQVVAVLDRYRNRSLL
jgi:hypothetical protein